MTAPTLVWSNLEGRVFGQATHGQVAVLREGPHRVDNGIPPYASLPALLHTLPNPAGTIKDGRTLYLPSCLSYFCSRIFQPVWWFLPPYSPPPPILLTPWCPWWTSRCQRSQDFKKKLVCCECVMKLVGCMSGVCLSKPLLVCGWHFVEKLFDSQHLLLFFSC